MPIRKKIETRAAGLLKNMTLNNAIRNSFYLVIFILSITELAQTTFNPFIYFRF
jgi:hypothetical protein